MERALHYPGASSIHKRRFRLPTRLPLTQIACASGLTPSQMEDIEFEIRLTSYSHDELNILNTNSQNILKEERCRSKDPSSPPPHNTSRQDPEVVN